MIKFATIIYIYLCAENLQINYNSDEFITLIEFITVNNIYYCDETCNTMMTSRVDDSINVMGMYPFDKDPQL